MLSTRMVSLADIPAVQQLADAQTARYRACDPPLPERIALPSWLVFTDDATCWLALAGRRPVGALSAMHERWPPDNPLANVFPRHYLRLRLFLAEDAAPADVLPVLLRCVEGWPGARGISGRMLNVPACDAALQAALRASGFAPYHAIAHRPMLPPPPCPPVDGLVIRAAANGDVPALAGLLAESWRFHAAHQPAIRLSDSLQEGCAEQVTLLMGSGGHQLLLVAEQQGVVVGFFGIGLSVQEPQVRPAFFARGHYGDIFEVAVRADWRRRGVGTAMFQAAWAWFARRDVQGVFVNYAPTNPLSSRFWPRLGFVDAWVNFWRA